VGHGADGHEDFSGGANGAADINGAAGRIRFSAGECRGGHVDFAHPALLIVQFQAVAVSAKSVGENDIGASLDEFAVELTHPLRMLEIPHLRRIARHQAHLEIVGAGGAVGQKPGTGVERFGEGRSGHGSLGK